VRIVERQVFFIGFAGLANQKKRPLGRASTQSAPLLSEEHRIACFSANYCNIEVCGWERRLKGRNVGG
jgi:hypothetical protein